MNFKKIFSFSAIYTVLAGIDKGAVLLLLPIVTTSLTAHQYGIVSSVIMITSFLTSICSLSLHGALFRYYSRYNERLRKVLVSTIFLFILALSFTSIFIITFIGWLYTNGNSSDLLFFPYWVFISLITPALTIVLFTLNVFKISEDIRFFVKFSLLKTILTSGLILYFILVMSLADVGYLYGMCISLFIMMSISIIYILFKYGVKFDYRLLRKSLVYSLPIVPISISNMIGNLVDRFYIIQFLGVASVGVYYLGIQITSIILIVMQAINSAYVPTFFKQIREGVDWKFYYYSEIYVSISMISSVIILVMSELFVSSYLSQEYYSIFEVLPILLIIVNVNSLYVLNTNLLSLKNRLVKVKTYVVLGGLFINIILGWMLTGSIGMLGAALSTLFSNLVIVLLFMYFNKKNNAVYYCNNKHLLQLSVNALVILVSGYILNDIMLKISFIFFYCICLLFYLYTRYKRSMKRG